MPARRSGPPNEQQPRSSWTSKADIALLSARGRKKPWKRIASTVASATGIPAYGDKRRCINRYYYLVRTFPPGGRGLRANASQDDKKRHKLLLAARAAYDKRNPAPVEQDRDEEAADEDPPRRARDESTSASQRPATDEDDDMEVDPSEAAGASKNFGHRGETWIDWFRPGKHVIVSVGTLSSAVGPLDVRITPKPREKQRPTRPVTGEQDEATVNARELVPDVNMAGEAEGSPGEDDGSTAHPGRERDIADTGTGDNEQARESSVEPVDDVAMDRVDEEGEGSHGSEELREISAPPAPQEATTRVGLDAMVNANPPETDPIQQALAALGQQYNERFRALQQQIVELGPIAENNKKAMTLFESLRQKNEDLAALLRVGLTQLQEELRESQTKAPAPCQHADDIEAHLDDTLSKLDSLGEGFRDLKVDSEQAQKERAELRGRVAAVEQYQSIRDADVDALWRQFFELKRELVQQIELYIQEQNLQREQQTN